MDELLNNPAFQAGVVPHVMALIVAALLLWTRMLGLAIGAGFAAVVALTVGFSIQTMASTPKLILSGICATVIVFILEALGTKPSRAVCAAVSCAAGLAAVWVAWRVLAHQEAAMAVAKGAAAALYVGLLVESGHRIGADPVRSASAALVLGLASGALALLGASALLAQFGIAIGAAAGGALLVQMIAGRRAPVGWTLPLVATVVAGLIGVLSVLNGALQWHALLPTLAIPWATRLVPTAGKPVWLVAVLASSAAMVPALVAGLLAWFPVGMSAS